MLRNVAARALRLIVLGARRQSTSVTPLGLTNPVNRLARRVTLQTFGFTPKKWLGNAVLALTVLQWLGFEDDDEEKETELIGILKRAVLCRQREQYDKAEQMLHLALRLAQQQHNTNGIIYSYDLMANLAMDRMQLEKAEKLFVAVLQMLMSGGMQEDSLKVIHISLKLARISHLLAREDTAELGYKWCLEKIEKQRVKSEDAKVLYGVIQDWYAQFLLDRGDVKQSLERLNEAYNICCEVDSDQSEEGMVLLNDLGITSWRAGNLSKAEEFLKKAAETGNRLDDQSHVGVIRANLGLVYLEMGLTAKAEETCRGAWKIGKKYENVESIEQSNYCLEQIKLFLAK